MNGNNFYNLEKIPIMLILKTETVERNAIGDPEMGGWVDTHNISLVDISGNIELLIYNIEDKQFVDSEIKSEFFQENVEHYSIDIDHEK